MPLGKFSSGGRRGLGQLLRDRRRSESYAAYNGRQAYIVKAQMSGNRVWSAVIGLVAGGKDFAIVTNMCAKYGLDPRNAN